MPRGVYLRTEAHRRSLSAARKKYYAEHPKIRNAVGEFTTLSKPYATALENSERRSLAAYRRWAKVRQQKKAEQSAQPKAPRSLWRTFTRFFSL